MFQAGRQPRFLEAVTILLLVVIVITLSARAQGGLVRSPLPLLLATGLVGLFCIGLGRPWWMLEKGLLDGVGRVVVAVLVLLLVGGLVAVWIEAGILPSLMYFGLQVASPGWFLPSAFLVCSVTSVATGSAYGTLGTMGTALMGVGSALGLSPPLVAGAVISGSFFGDKMSPLSETTNIAAAMGQVDLFRHIRSMLYTTVPASLLSLLLFALAGSPAGSAESARTSEMLSTLAQHWHVGWIHLLPVVLLMLLAAHRLPALALMFSMVLAGGLWAMLFQGSSLTGVVAAITGGFVSQTGLPAIDQVLSRGGMLGMSQVCWLILGAGCLGGALQVSGILTVSMRTLLGGVRGPAGLVSSVLASCYAVLLFTGSQSLSLVLPGQMFLGEFRRLRIDRSVMTRSLEDAGTIGAPLVPWSGVGVTSSQLLGVATLHYLPYAWFIFLVPVFSLLCAFSGFGIWREKEQPVASTSVEVKG